MPTDPQRATRWGRADSDAPVKKCHSRPPRRAAASTPRRETAADSGPPCQVARVWQRWRMRWALARAKWRLDSADKANRRQQNRRAVSPSPYISDSGQARMKFRPPCHPTDAIEFSSSTFQKRQAGMTQAAQYDDAGITVVPPPQPKMPPRLASRGFQK